MRTARTLVALVVLALAGRSAYAFDIPCAQQCGMEAEQAFQQPEVVGRPGAQADRHRTLTLRDVSEASGVSEMTVSRVLRSRGDVSETTRAKVLEAARALGYVPNKIAGALACK